MSEKRSLLDWFGTRRESKIMNQLTAHSLKVVDTVNELDIAVGWMAKGEVKAATEAIERLKINEREADTFEEMVNEELSKGDIGPEERGDLLRLVRMLDNIADYSKEAGRSILLFNDLGMDVPSCIWDTVGGMTKALLESTNHLQDAIESLSVSGEETMRRRNRVETCERDLDQLFYRTMRILFSQEIGFREAFVVRDVLRAIENASDRVKDTTDMLHILVTSERHMVR